MAERSSILLLGRNTVIIGALLITVASFGMGYFFGYKGVGPSEQEKPELADRDEKKVIEAPASAVTKPAPPQKVSDFSGTPAAPVTAAATSTIPSSSAAMPSSTNKPAQGPDERIERSERSERIEQQRVEQQRVEQRVAEAAAQKPASQSPPSASENPGKSSTQATRIAQATPAAQADSAHPKGARHVKKKGQYSKTGVSSKKLYTVQVGAFPNKEGAEQLSRQLKAHGYTPYLVNASGNSAYFKVRVGAFKRKKDAEKSAAALSKKTGLQNFITVAQ